MASVTIRTESDTYERFSKRGRRRISERIEKVMADTLGIGVKANEVAWEHPFESGVSRNLPDLELIVMMADWGEEFTNELKDELVNSLENLGDTLTGSYRITIRFIHIADEHTVIKELERANE